ncbi:hypothetical protein [Humisphaera borealis]|uniref:Uncharacterized protein n=1 Tax=Humisphaera borealis TaxID=2807512 RepID=A0A7M2WXI8_9BACT|nr:hypothetical protein [Humisphaera borealis]QOV90196.1 hypothetical protein IPV69_02140 [Humisphaera borealis]
MVEFELLQVTKEHDPKWDGLGGIRIVSTEWINAADMTWEAVMLNQTLVARQALCLVGCKVSTVQKLDECGKEYRKQGRAALRTINEGSVAIVAGLRLESPCLFAPVDAPLLSDPPKGLTEALLPPNNPGDWRSGWNAIVKDVCSLQIDLDLRFAETLLQASSSVVDAVFELKKASAIPSRLVLLERKVAGWLFCRSEYRDWLRGHLKILGWYLSVYRKAPIAAQ